MSVYVCLSHCPGRTYDVWKVRPPPHTQLHVFAPVGCCAAPPVTGAAGAATPAEVLIASPVGCPCVISFASLWASVASTVASQQVVHRLLLSGLSNHQPHMNVYVPRVYKVGLELTFHWISIIHRIQYDEISFVWHVVCWWHTRLKVSRNRELIGGQSLVGILTELGRILIARLGVSCGRKVRSCRSATQLITAWLPRVMENRENREFQHSIFQTLNVME